MNDFIWGILSISGLFVVNGKALYIAVSSPDKSVLKLLKAVGGNIYGPYGMNRNMQWRISGVELRQLIILLDKQIPDCKRGEEYKKWRKENFG